MQYQREYPEAASLQKAERDRQALTDSKLFTGMEGRLISVGFQSGSADEALNQLSVKYREKAVDLISEAISIVEPTIVIILFQCLLFFVKGFIGCKADTDEKNAADQNEKA